MSTLKSISQKVSLLYSRHQDKDNSNTTLDWREVKTHLVPIINSIMGASFVRLQDTDLGVNISSGMAFRYTVSVLNRDLGNGTEYYIQLPAYPIRMRHDLGIFSIGPLSPLLSPYIIVPRAYWDTLGPTDFEDNIVAIPLGNNEVVFTEDPGVSVAVTLIVCDSDEFTDDELIPMPPEFEWAAIQEVLKIYLPQVILDEDMKNEMLAKQTKTEEKTLDHDAQ